MNLFISGFEYGQKNSKTYFFNCFVGACGGTGLFAVLRLWPAGAVWKYVYGRIKK